MWKADMQVVKIEIHLMGFQRDVKLKYEAKSAL